MIDRADLDTAIHNVNLRMRSHGGGIELTSITEDGDVSVRFTGMCCGCPYKALTWRGTVQPMLRSVEAVTGLSAPGVRISEEAEDRLLRYEAIEYSSVSQTAHGSHDHRQPRRGEPRLDR